MGKLLFENESLAEATLEDWLDPRGIFLPGSTSKTGIDSARICPWDVAGLGCPMWLALSAPESLMLASSGCLLLSLREDWIADKPNKLLLG